MAKIKSVHNIDSLRELQRRREALRRTEPFPYAESLRSVMESSVYTEPRGSTVQRAVSEMSRRGISSVVVVDEDDKPVGIITERDIIRKIAVGDCKDLETTSLGSIMSTNIHTLSPDDTIYRSLSSLSSKNIKHLPIVENGKVVGIVTTRQLLRLRYPEPLMLIEGVHQARNVEALKRIKAQLPKLAASKLKRGISAHEIVVMFSLINQDLHIRALELAIEEAGPPPAEFCFFLTGSHGRMENMLTSDQDQCMIISDEALDDPVAHDYFMYLGKTVSDSLAEIGFIYCPGYIMSVNPTWRKTLSEWLVQVSYWFERQGPSLVRYMTILYDALPVYGDASLFAPLSEHAYSLMSRHREVLRLMHDEEGSHRVPISIFGTFITEKNGSHRGELDIKRSGLIFMVEGVRILSLIHGIRETSTIKRIRALVDGSFINANDGDYFEAAYEILLHHSLEAQVTKALAGEPINTFLNLKQLTTRDKAMLKHALKAVSGLQELVATEFGEIVI